MRKKLLSLFFTFVIACLCAGVTAFADSDTLILDCSLPPNYTTSIGKEGQYILTYSINTSIYDGQLIGIPLVGNDAADGIDGNGANGVCYLNVFEGATWGVTEVVDASGLPIAHWVGDNVLYLVPPKGRTSRVTFNLILTGDNLSSPTGLVHVTVNSSVRVTVVDYISEVSLSEILDMLQYDISDISSNMEVVRQYLYAVMDEAGETNDNLTYILNQLEWIVSEMEGNVVSNLLGEYAGYNYSQLFVEMINAIKNISIGDITGNITVQTDLSQVISNLVTVANAYNNINQFDYTGKMYFRPVNIISRYGPNQGVATSAYNPSIEYLTLGGKPSFRIVPQESRVYKVDLLNMKLGTGVNTLLPLMPGNYRISFRALTRSVGSTLTDFDGSTLYLYNTDVGFIPLEWSAVEDSYSSGYFVYSCTVDVYIPTGSNCGSVQLYFPNGAGIWSNNSVWTIEFQQLDLTYVEINDHLEQIAYLIEQTNNLLAQINENIDNSNLGSSLDSYDQVEGTAQDNFEADYSIVTGAIDGVLGVVGTSGLTNVVAFINGNFTKIWNAMGIFKTLIVTSLLFGLALVFVGRSGKVK